jgi:hypothetical protein
MQRDYIAYGAHWDTALHGLVVLADARELPLIPGAQQALDGLLATVRARFPSHEALVAALDREWPDYEPWRQWAQRDTEIAAALTEAKTGYLRSQRPRTPAATNLSTRDILARPDVRSFRRELAARRGGENAALLLEAARSGSGDTQAAALIALGKQNDPRVLETALSLLPSAPPPPAPSWLRYAILHALSGLPSDPGLVYARKWYQADNFVLRRSAENIFARHAEPEDATMLREGARCAFEEGDDYRVCDAMDALARIPQLGPYPEVRAVFDGHRYSRARADAAAALAATDPSFPRDRAFECLWDCDDSARATGCAHVDLALPGARERLVRVLCSARRASCSSPLRTARCCRATSTSPRSCAAPWPGPASFAATSTSAAAASGGASRRRRTAQSAAARSAMRRCGPRQCPSLHLPRAAPYNRDAAPRCRRGPLGRAKNASPHRCAGHHRAVRAPRAWLSAGTDRTLETHRFCFPLASSCRERRRSRRGAG